MGEKKPATPYPLLPSLPDNFPSVVLNYAPRAREGKKKETIIKKPVTPILLLPSMHDNPPSAILSKETRPRKSKKKKKNI